MIKRWTVLAFLIWASILVAGWSEDRADGRVIRGSENSELIGLGARLFREERFSTPNGDLPASCSNCHMYNEDPQGLRAFADFFNRSWVSSRSLDQRRLMARNSPTLFDVDQMPRLHYDGEFRSLEDLVKGTFSGRPMGWLPGEESDALARIRRVLLADEGQGAGVMSYRRQFRSVFGVDLDRIDDAAAADLTARAVAAFMRTLKSRRDSPYDNFIKRNNLQSAPAGGVAPARFGSLLINDIARLESQGVLSFNPGFGKLELEGLKIFFRTSGSASAGNCVTCHAPPFFTDFSFHNKGISQREYDMIHGEGKFAKLEIPGPGEAVRPNANFRETPIKVKPERVDLGYWNFADLGDRASRRMGETDRQFLDRMIATFKTPSLRNLAYTHPYFHDGSIYSLEAVIEEMIRLSDHARAGRIRSADDELGRIRIGHSDIAALTAFLSALNDDLK